MEACSAFCLVQRDKEDENSVTVTLQILFTPEDFIYLRKIGQSIP